MLMLGFGQAPAAKEAGYAVLVEELDGTPEALQQRFADRDVALVQGPALAERPGEFSFGVFARAAEVEGTAAPEIGDYSFHFGSESDGDLAGRWWWVVTCDGWSGYETSSESFDTETEAREDAARHLWEQFGKR